MNDTDYMENVYDSTDEAGFRVMTWYNAGTRIVLRGQKPLALCDRCPCFGSLFPRCV